MCAPGDLNGDGVPDLITGANQREEGWGYILYLNADKTVKTYTRINNVDVGFGLSLATEERFSRSISFIGDLGGDGTIAVNFGGGAGATGVLYVFFFKPCGFYQESGFNHWDHASQMLTSDSFSFEQCTFKAFETDATNVTYNDNDGRCICKDFTASLVTSSEFSTAYSNACFSGSTSLALGFNSFTANKKKCNIELSWSSNNHNGLSHYDLEWSTHDNVFNTIATIIKHSDSNESNFYYYIDDRSGLNNYYRLKRHDLDGGFSYSETISVRSDCDGGHLKVYPSPVSLSDGFIHIELDSDINNYDILIYDI